MEIHALHQVSHGFWLKSSQMRIANFTAIARKFNKSSAQKLWCVSRVSGEVSAVDGFDQLFRHFDNLLSSQPNAIVFVNVVGRRIRYRRLFCLLVRRLFRLCNDAFACPNSLFDNKSSVKIGFGALRGVEILLEKFRVANIVVRIAPFNFRRALNFFRQSTVS